MTLSKRFMTGTLSVALAFGFLLAGCGGGDDNNNSATPTLAEEIAKAEALADVMVGVQAEMLEGRKYVSQDAMDAFQDAIAAARAVKANGAASQAEKDAAIQALRAASAVFKDAIKTDGTATPVTLSGTIRINDGGAPVPFVAIDVYRNDGRYLMWWNCEKPPVAGKGWEVTIPAGETVRIQLVGFDKSDPDSRTRLYSQTQEVSVSAQSSPIDFDIGDIDVGRMKGTVTFSPLPGVSYDQIAIRAQTANGTWLNNGTASPITLNGSAGAWTIPRDDAFFAALGSATQTVKFYVDVRFNKEGDYVNFDTVDKTISKTGLTGIDLGTVRLVTPILRGTISMNDGGKPVPWVAIEAYPADSWNWLAGAYFTPLPATAQPWAMELPLPVGQTVRLEVFGYDKADRDSRTLLYNESREVTISAQTVSGIDFDIGDISGWPGTGQ